MSVAGRDEDYRMEIPQLSLKKVLFSGDTQNFSGD